ncbi:MAG TPA: two-component regulator propeller domain-containing protein [Burkholderiales bacterium]
MAFRLSHLSLLLAFASGSALSEPPIERLLPPPAEQAPQGPAKSDVPANVTHFRVGNRNVKSIYVEGNTAWVGTSGGLVRYDTRDGSFKLFDTRGGLLSNGMFAVRKVHGKIAVGTYGGGLSLLDERSETWKTYNIPDGLGDGFVYDILSASNGDIWIATWSGVNRVRGGKLDDPRQWDLFTVANTKGGLPNDWVYALAEGKGGDVWLATEGGVALFSGGRWQNWNHAKGLGAPFDKVKNDIAFKADPSLESRHHARQKEEMGLQAVNVAYNPNYVIALKIDARGDVWAGTWGGGLSRFDGKQWVTYTTAEGLPSNHVFMLQTDPSGDLWVGTNNGLALWRDGKVVRNLTVAEGLFSNNVFTMAATPQGDFWVGSFGGVAHLRGAKMGAAR